MRKMALVLQGGGALGAYEYGVVTKLVDMGWEPVAVTGVSIGAVNAAAIAGARMNAPVGWTGFPSTRPTSASAA